MDATASDCQDTRILGLISTGHFLSHFYFLTLPPLFPLLKEAFGVGYTELGLMMTLTYAASALAQVPVGFLVDRIGARLVLTVGLALLAVGFGLVGLAPSFVVVLGLTMMAGLGHSVFHPADYAILNASDEPRAHRARLQRPHLRGPPRIGRGSRRDDRARGRLGLAHGARHRRSFRSRRVARDDDPMEDLAGRCAETQEEAEARQGREGFGWPSRRGERLSLLFSRPMILFFLFFATLSMTSTGMQAFSVSALVTLHDMPVATASAALTAYLFCSAAGILVGGEIADRTKRTTSWPGSSS